MAASPACGVLGLLACPLCVKGSDLSVQCGKGQFGVLADLIHLALL